MKREVRATEDNVLGGRLPCELSCRRHSDRRKVTIAPGVLLRKVDGFFCHACAHDHGLSGGRKAITRGIM